MNTVRTAPRRAAHDVTQLDALIDGDVYTADDDDWDDARRAWNLAVDQQPAAVAIPASAADVAEIVEFARSEGLRVAPQGTGHGAATLGALDEHDPRQAPPPARRHGRRRAPGRTRRSRSDLDRRGRSRGCTRPGGARRLVARCRRRGLHARRRALVARAQARARREPRHRGRDRDRGRHAAPDRPGERSRPLLGDSRRRRQPGHRYGARVRAPRATPRCMPESSGSRSTARTRCCGDGATGPTDVPDEMTSVGRILQFPPLPEFPEEIRGKSFVVVEAIWSGPQDGRREVGRAAARSRSGAGHGLDDLRCPRSRRLHMDPEHPVPGVGEGGTARRLRQRCDRAAIAGTVGAPLLSMEVRHLGGAVGRPRPHHGAVGSFEAPYAWFAVGIAPTPEAQSAVHATAQGLRARLEPWEAPHTYLNFSQTDAGCVGALRRGARPAAADQGRLRPAGRDQVERPVLVAEDRIAPAAPVGSVLPAQPPCGSAAERAAPRGAIREALRLGEDQGTVSPRDR